VPEVLESASRADAETAEFFRRAWRFDFFQAVKVLEGLVRSERTALGEECAPPGGSNDPAEEALRFTSTVSLAHQASDIRRVIVWPRDRDQPKMQVNFLGLCGARGPMPNWYAELIRDRTILGDHGLRAFLDLFNHRLVSLLYRVRQRHRPTLNTERPETHPFAGYLMSFAGLGTPAARACLEEAREETGAGIAPRDLIFYAGLFWRRDRSMIGLERLLAHYFKLAFRGRQLTGGWLRLAPEERTALTTRRGHNRLGVTTIAGSRVANPQAGFELIADDLCWDDFVDFLPVGRRLSALVLLVNLYTRSAFDFHLRLRVRAEAVLPSRPALSATSGPRLGWTSWLLTRPLEGEAAEIRVPGRPLAAL